MERNSGKEILQTVLGLKLEFLGEKHKSYIPQFYKHDPSFIDLEIQKLLSKGVISKREHESGDYVSPLLIRQKPDGLFRLILNLKILNGDMSYIHFEMETLQSTLSLITLGYFCHHWT